MFSKNTIDKIYDLPLEEVIGKYVDLKKSGSTYKGVSPFTDEKTPSFMVSPAKNIWKCFSTGKGGGSAIKFVQEHRGLSFPEAINEIATKCGVQIELDGESGSAHMERYNRIIEINDVNQQALDFWRSNIVDEKETLLKNIPDAAKDQLMRMSETQINRFQIGYAPPGYDTLKDHLLKKGVSIDLMIRAGIVKSKQEETANGTIVKNYDLFNGRIIFPIYTHTGKLIGFSGRIIKEDPNKKSPKVLNSPDSEAYKKSESFLGLNLAKSEIIAAGYAIKVEGNFDITAFHQKGLTNTVATLGTAFTPEQCRLLKRFAAKIVIAVDRDKAGLKGIEKDVKTCVAEGVKVDVWMSDQEGEDPYDFAARNSDITNENFIQLFNSMRMDAVEWLAQSYFEDAETVQQKHEAQQKLISLLCEIADGSFRNQYVRHFVKEYAIVKSDVEKNISTELAQRKSKLEEKNNNHGLPLPHYLSEDAIRDFNEYQFYADETEGKIGYWFKTQYDTFERVSNFIVKPIFQVESLTDSKRIVEIRNYSNNSFNTALVELPNNAFVNKTDFEKVVTNQGNYYWDGSPKQHQKLRRKLLAQFPYCREIRTLGWQREGFFAFSNGIIENSFKEVNEYGICIHGNRNYFLPAFSKIYKGIQSEDDVYENDRKFVFKQSGVTFREWAATFNEVYKDSNNGMIASAFLLAALFSDFIHSINNDFPILFMFGQPRTGKTTCSMSISRIFKDDPSPFNLNQGTPIAFTRRLARARNVIEHFDEYQNDIDEKRFQSLKGVFDRTGHEKGVLSRDNRTEVTKINAAVVISGQHQPTRDNNSLYTRIIELRFSKKADEFTKEESEVFRKLSGMERKGLSNIIVEIVRFRDLIESEFPSTQVQVFSKMKDQLRGNDIDGRVMKNLVVLCTMVELLGERLGLPYSSEAFFNEAKEIITRQSAIIADSDDLAEFFKMFQFLVLDQKLKDGEDFKIEKIETLHVREGRKGPKTLVFDAPTEVLHINMSKVYLLYAQYTRSQKGQNPLPESTIKSHMREHKSFIGTPPSMKFSNQQTSAYSFYYRNLDISIRSEEETKPINNEHTPAIQGHGFQQKGMFGDKNGIDDDLPF